MKRAKASRATPPASLSIEVTGARENNLKGVDLELPRHQIIGVVGVSGSGKSSLLFQTLAAESQARHLASLPRPSRSARPRWPRVDRITGLPFCLTVSQRALHRNPRSTVATYTGLHEVFRRLVCDFGELHCTCGAVVEPTGPQRLLEFLRAEYKGRTVTISAVVAREPLPPLRALEAKLLAERLRRVALQGLPWGPRRTRPLKGLGSLDQNQIHAVFAPLAEHKVNAMQESPLQAAIERAFALGAGGALVEIAPARRGQAPVEVVTDRQAVCCACHQVHRLPDDPLLAFNSAPEWSGRCPRCEGLGVVDEVALDALIPDPARSIDDGCFALRRERDSYKHLGIREDVVRGVCAAHDDSSDRAFRRLGEETRRALLYGMGDARVQPITTAGKKSGAKVRYHGLIPTLTRLVGSSGAAADYARTFVARNTCPACDGTRFDNDALAGYRYHGRRFTELMSASVEAAGELLTGCRAAATDSERRWLDAGARSLGSLVSAGLGYVGMNRSSSTLSGGELQRLKIAASLYEGAVHSCYILDEPSLGLHSSDNRGLITVLRQLRAAGNTVIVADHDPELTGIADRVVTLGPGAGAAGGEVLSVAPPGNADERERAPGRSRLPLEPSRALTISGASVHNLRALDISIPLGGLVCLTGVSGSGKSSFAHHILYPAVEAFLASGRRSGPTWTRLDGGGLVRRIERVGQQPLSTSMVSVLATYLGIFDAVRQRFAATDAARSRGYTATEFSFNRAEGRCPTCAGRGTVAEDQTSVEMLDCPHCGGTRFIDAVLDIRWQGLTVADVLRLEASEARRRFSDDEAIAGPLRLVEELGIGHLQLGRPTPTLSGGEAQRLKLAASLRGLGDQRDGLVFILDEPSAGLSRSDLAALLRCFDSLLAGGANTLVVIEHNLDVVAVADHIVDFGPGAGEHGGQVVYQGSPQEAPADGSCRTGEALRSRGFEQAPREADASEAVSQGGLVVADDEASDIAAAAERFLKALRKLDLATASNDRQELAVVSPTYAVSADPTSFATDAQVLDGLGLGGRLNAALLAHVQPPAVDGGELVADARSAVTVARRLKRPVQIEFSPLTAALESGTATRTAAVAALQACAQRGFEWFTVGDTENPLSEVKRSMLDGADLFSIRVIAGALPDADSPAIALLELALAAGQGWVTARQRLGRTAREMQITTRPLSVDARRIGRRRLVPALLDRRVDGGCPFCEGRGLLSSFAEKLVIADWRRTATEPGLLTSAARELLRPVHGRLVKTLRYLDDEGVLELGSLAAHTQRGILLFGYPWRFLIPGRKSGRDVDYYAWPGLMSLVAGRLHLARDQTWRDKVEASRTDISCFACSGTGFDWQIRCSTAFGRPVWELLTETPIATLVQTLGRELREPGQHLVLEALEALEAAGLGDATLATRARDLSADARERLRAVGVRCAPLAEATYRLGFASETTYCAVEPALRHAARNCRVLVTLGERKDRGA